MFEVFHGVIIDAVEKAKAKNKSNKQSQSARCKSRSDDHDDEPPSTPGTTDKELEQEQEPAHQGKLILDATVAPQAIRYPTDLNLLNEVLGANSCSSGYWQLIQTTATGFPSVIVQASNVLIGHNQTDGKKSQVAHSLDSLSGTQRFASLGLCLGMSYERRICHQKDRRSKACPDPL